MIDAKLARAIANICATSNTLTAKFILDALTEIASAACQGKTAIKMGTGSGHHRESITEALSNLGYTIQWMPRPEQGWHYAHISW
ncbi:MAG TPA: hypothetical protein VF450_00650 [Noviherbaspirillum sp.]